MDPRIADSSPTERAKTMTTAFNVAVLYESSDAATRAKQFSYQLVNGVAANRVLNLNHWDFRLLGRRVIRNAAASDAADADMVILSMSGESPLPAQVERWIEMWTWLIDGRKPTVVALFATHNLESRRIGTFLRRGTACKGLTFFPHNGRTA
jgi:hypothetical protein